MQTVSCPSCGAPVTFKSHASVMAVCDYCRASVLKDLDSVKDIGKISAVLEDYSPFQIGTAGVFGGVAFTVIGRIQLRYDQGMWNEWYLMFQDASTGWLSDASGQYAITRLRPTPAGVPAFDQVVPGRNYVIDQLRYTAADRRESECIGGQGELPFKIGDGWRVRAADLRSGATFLTLDYTEGEAAVAYAGRAVALDSLKAQLLRDAEQIKASAGRYRGTIDALDCPQCGSAIKYVPGATANIVCPACAAQLDASRPEVAVLAAGERRPPRPFTLELGASARIRNQQYSVIGAMVRADSDGEHWNEYLLYSVKAGFLWLVETSEGWAQSTALDDWPEWDPSRPERASLANKPFRFLYEYPSKVMYAAGAFNWRVAAGDETRVYEYESGDTKLAAELTPTELGWSSSTPVTGEQMAAWFPKAAATPSPKAGPTARKSLYATQMKFVWWILGLNAIPMLLAFGDTFMITVGAIIALFYPAKYFQGEEDDS